MDTVSTAHESPTGTIHRYKLLDALRGVAAVAVLLHHFASRLNAPVTFSHGYLAVDFFFMLSGFVLAHAYQNRLGKMPAWEFARIRVIRLLPMSVLGLAMGTTYLLFRWKMQPDLSDTLPQILGASALNMVLLPKPWVGSATGSEVFPANGVLWSLSLELMINLVWAAGLFRLRPTFQLLIGLAGAALVVALTLDQGSASLGWNWPTYVGGVSRTVFGFMIGIVIWRVRPPIKRSKRRAVAAGLLLLAAFAMPIESALYDLAVILLFFPAMLYISTGIEIEGRRGLARILGDISYPVYAIHLPILMAIAGAMKRFGGFHASAPWQIYLAAVPIIAVAWGAEHWYEAPLRRWLGRRTVVSGALSRHRKQIAP